MPTNVNQAKLVIPTGYENEQRKLARRQALAQALLEKGLAGPGTNATSWTQPIASIAQAWAGKRMLRKADEQQGELDQKIRAEYSTKIGQIQEDVLAAGNDPQALQQVIFKWQSDPLVQEVLKPVMDRHQKMLTDRDAITTEGRIMATKRDFMQTNGGILPDDPTTQRVITDPQTGQLVVNPAWVAASQAAQGLSPAEGSTPFVSQPDTRQGVIQSMMANRAAGPSQAKPTAAGPELPALPGASTAAVPPPFSKDSTGKPYWLINGRLFDNPEGR